MITDIKIDQLNDSLKSQFSDLMKADGRTKHNVVVYSVSGDSSSSTKTIVSVSMTSIDKSHTIPEGAAFCGGKMREDVATVVINPSNDRVKEVVKEYFSEETDGIFGMPPMPMFDSVKINDQVLDGCIK